MELTQEVLDRGDVVGGEYFLSTPISMPPGRVVSDATITFREGGSMALHGSLTGCTIAGGGLVADADGNGWLRYSPIGGDR